MIPKPWTLGFLGTNNIKCVSSWRDRLRAKSLQVHWLISAISKSRAVGGYIPSLQHLFGQEDRYHSSPRIGAA